MPYINFEDDIDGYASPTRIWRRKRKRIERIRKRVSTNKSYEWEVENGPSFFNRDGQPIDYAVFRVLWDDPNYKEVGETTVLTPLARFSVWTRWVGTNERLKGEGPPLIFRTLVVVDEDVVTRMLHSTQAEAIRQHDKYVRIVRNLLDDDDYRPLDEKGA